MHPAWQSAHLLLILVAVVDAVHLLGADREDQAVGLDAAVGQRDADPRVGQLTGKDAAVASVEATVAVLQRAAFLALGAAGAGRSADSGRSVAAVASGRLRAVVDGAVAAVIGLAHKEWARDVASGAQVGHDDLVLVQLSAGNWRRFGDPALRVAVRSAVWRLDCAQAERGTLWQAAAWLARNTNLAADGSGLQNKRRLRLLVNERQSLALAVGVQVARQSQARLNGVQAVAFGRVLVLLRLQERKRTVFKNETESVCASESIIRKLRESR